MTNESFRNHELAPASGSCARYAVTSHLSLAFLNLFLVGVRALCGVGHRYHHRLPCQHLCSVCPLAYQLGVPRWTARDFSGHARVFSRKLDKACASERGPDPHQASPRDTAGERRERRAATGGSMSRKISAEPARAIVVWQGREDICSWKSIQENRVFEEYLHQRT